MQFVVIRDGNPGNFPKAVALYFFAPGDAGFISTVKIIEDALGREISQFEMFRNSGRLCQVFVVEFIAANQEFTSKCF